MGDSTAAAGSPAECLTCFCNGFHDCNPPECDCPQCFPVEVDCGPCRVCAGIRGCVYDCARCCDDGDGCTADDCDDAGCRHTPRCDVRQCQVCLDDACVFICDDEDPCTVDLCADGACEHQPQCPPDEDPCTRDGCLAGRCFSEPLDCDDRNPCSLDDCADGACVHLAACPPDSDPCTVDTCRDGTCLHDPLDCDDDNPCTLDACESGSCVHTPLCPPDGNPCTLDACIAGVCHHDLLDCDDGNLCTVEGCVDGACLYEPLCPPDSDPCTVDACANGVCLHTSCPADGPCAPRCCLDGQCLPDQPARPCSLSLESAAGCPGAEVSLAGELCNTSPCAAWYEWTAGRSAEDSPAIVQPPAHGWVLLDGQACTALSVGALIVGDAAPGGQAAIQVTAWSESSGACGTVVQQVCAADAQVRVAPPSGGARLGISLDLWDPTLDAADVPPNPLRPGILRRGSTWSYACGPGQPADTPELRHRVVLHVSNPDVSGGMIAGPEGDTGALTRMTPEFFAGQSVMWNQRWNALFGNDWASPYTAARVMQCYVQALCLDEAELTDERYWITPEIGQTGPYSIELSGPRVKERPLDLHVQAHDAVIRVYKSRPDPLLGLGSYRLYALPDGDDTAATWGETVNGEFIAPDTTTYTIEAVGAHQNARAYLGAWYGGGIELTAPQDVPLTAGQVLRFSVRAYHTNQRFPLTLRFDRPGACAELRVTFDVGPLEFTEAADVRPQFRIHTNGDLEMRLPQGRLLSAPFIAGRRNAADYNGRLHEGHALGWRRVSPTHFESPPPTVHVYQGTLAATADPWVSVLHYHTVTDRAGTVLWSYAYRSDGDLPQLTDSYRGTSDRHSLHIERLCDARGRCTRKTYTSLHDPGGTRVEHLLYARGRYIGSVWDPGDRAAGAGPCGLGRPLVYRDRRGRITHLRTAEIGAEGLPQGEFLEAFEYHDAEDCGFGPCADRCDDRMTRWLRRTATGAWVVLEHSTYEDLPDGGFIATRRLPVAGPNAYGPQSEDRHAEGFLELPDSPSHGPLERIRQEVVDADGRLGEIRTYPDLVPWGAPPSGTPEIAGRTVSQTEIGNQVVGDSVVWTLPSGQINARQWMLEGPPYAPGSARHQTVMVNGVEHTRTTQAFIGPDAGYLPVDHTVTLAADAQYHALAFEYSPEGDLQRVESSPPSPAADGRPAATVIDYTAAGLIDAVHRPGSAGTTTDRFEYDALGRLTATVRAAESQPLRTEYGYNDYDELRYAHLVPAGGAATGRVIAYHYHPALGRLQEVWTYAGQPGDDQPLLFTQTHYAYDPLTAGPVTESVYLSHEPFRPAAPPDPAGADAAVWIQTQAHYDASGRWLTGITEAGERTTTCQHNHQGEMTTAVDPVGVVREVHRDGAGRTLAEITRASGLEQRTDLAYDTFGRLRRVIAPDRTAVEFEYDAADRLSAIYECDTTAGCSGQSIETLITRNTAGLPLRVFIPGVADTIIDYDDWGRTCRVRERVEPGVDHDVEQLDAPGPQAADRVRLLEYDAAGRLRCEIFKLGANPDAVEPNDALNVYTYDNHGRLVTASDPAGGITRLTYDPDAGQLIERVVGDGELNLSTTYAYDALGRLTGITDPDGHHSLLDYASDNRLSRNLRLDGATGIAVDQVRIEYDAGRRPCSLVRLADPMAEPDRVPDPAIDHVVDVTFRADDQPETIICRNMNSADPHVTTLAYDALGRMTQLSDPLDTTVRTTYRADGLPGERILTDAFGVQVTRYGYDPFKRVVQVTDVGGQAALTTTLGYDAAGHVHTIIDPAGQVTTVEHDPLGRPVRLCEDAGRLERITDRRFDRLDRLRRPIAHDNGALQTTAYDYDPLKRSWNAAFPPSDHAGHPKSDPAPATNWVHDAASRVITRVDADQTVTHIGYDGNGRIRSVEVVSGSDYREYAYDALGRLTLARRGTPQSGAEQSISRLDIEYIGSDVIVETQTVFDDPALRKTIVRELDQAGNQIYLHYPADIGLRLDYQRDALGRVLAMQGATAAGAEPLAAYQYQGDLPVAREIHTTGGAVLRLELGYDDQRRLRSLVNRIDDRPAAAAFEWTHDTAGNTVSQTSWGNALHAADREFDYDGLDRLRWASGPDGPRGYLRDALGNPEAASGDLNCGYWNWAYAANTPRNQITHSQGLTPDGSQVTLSSTYAVHGPLQGQSIEVDGQPPVNWHFEYTAAGRIRRITDHTACAVAEFAYDALGRRIYRVLRAPEDGCAVREAAVSVHDGQTALAEYDPAGQPQRYFVQGALYIDEHIRVTNGSEHAYYLTGPGFGSAGLVDEAGELLELYDYSPFGQTRVFVRSGDRDRQAQGSDLCLERVEDTLVRSAASPRNPYLFHGRWLDIVGQAVVDDPARSRQFYDYRARTYDPLLRQFLQPDPLGYREGMHLYQAFGDNPLRYLDPMGRGLLDRLVNLLYLHEYGETDELQEAIGRGATLGSISTFHERQLRDAAESLLGLTPLGWVSGVTVDPGQILAETGRTLSDTGWAVLRAHQEAIGQTTQAIVDFKAAQQQAARQTSLPEDLAFGTLQLLGLTALPEAAYNVSLTDDRFIALSDQPVDFLLFEGNERQRRLIAGLGETALVAGGIARQPTAVLGRGSLRLVATAAERQTFSAIGRRLAGLDRIGNPFMLQFARYDLRQGLLFDGIYPKEVTITLRRMPDMPVHQFNKKARALQELGEQGALIKAPFSAKRASGLPKRFKKDVIRRIKRQYGWRNPEFSRRLCHRIQNGFDVDHVWDLQLGGPDIATNMTMLHNSVNKHLGLHQIWPQIRQLFPGTKIRIRIAEY